MMGNEANFLAELEHLVLKYDLTLNERASLLCGYLAGYSYYCAEPGKYLKMLGDVIYEKAQQVWDEKENNGEEKFPIKSIPFITNDAAVDFLLRKYGPRDT